MMVRGDCLKYLKRGGTEQRGRYTQILEGGQAGSRGECLKKQGGGGAGTLLQTMSISIDGLKVLHQVLPFVTFSTSITKPFQERHTITCACVHTCSKVFRHVINSMRK